MAIVQGNTATHIVRNLQNAETITPDSVYREHGKVFLGIWLVTLLLLSFIPFIPYFFWSFIVAGVIYGLGYIATGIGAVYVKTFKGTAVTHSTTGKLRAIFVGLHLKSYNEDVFTEDGKKKFWDLQSFLTADVLKNWGTKLQTLNMDALFTLNMWCDVSGTAEQAAEKFLRFISFKDGAIIHKAKSTVGSMFSTYYSRTSINSLNKEAEVMEKVFDKQINHDIFANFQTSHGVGLEVILENSGPDKASIIIMLPETKAIYTTKAMRKYQKVKGMTNEDMMSMVRLQAGGTYKEEKLIWQVPEHTTINVIGGVGMNGGFAQPTKKG